MQCMECGAEMRFVEAIGDGAMPAAGYEDQRFECTGCRQVERRRVFRGEQASTPSATPVPSGNTEALNEDQELLRRAIAMVRGPISASQTIRGITDGLKSPAALPAGATRAGKSGRVVQIRHDANYDAAYAAKDTRTGLVVLRHQDSARLRQMCARLGWQVVEDGASPVE
jgi:plasmid stabilization system protein ParE